MTDFKKQLQSCRTLTEALPIMEALKVRPSQRKLIETAIQLGNSPDNRQKAYGLDFMQTAIKELEDDEKKNLKEDNGGAHRDQGGEADISGIIKKNQEADMITGALDSHQSSDIDQPYPKEGTNAPQNDIEGTDSATGENQMGGIKENMPGMPPMQPQQMGAPPMGQMPPQPGMPPMAPDLMKQMAPQMPQMPPMNTQQQMRQMQYTIDVNFKRLNPLIREVKKLREANVALDHKVQELENQKGAMRLDIDKVKANSVVRDHAIRETTSMYDGVNFPEPTQYTRMELENTRQHIADIDKQLSQASPYK